MTLENFDQAVFLEHYWQQQPLLIRQAIPDYQCPIDETEIAEISLEDNAEARLIIEHKPSQWRLETGPFTADRFGDLPKHKWTLLVQAIDHWVPDIAQLKSLFSFLPSWRLDDIMVSVATEGGSVGPHFDQYDVFLLQAKGSREWLVGQQCAIDEPQNNHSGLRLLDTFTEQSREILHPGDIYYIPPGKAHWGISNSADCITLSIGFRAPSFAEIIDELSQELIAKLDESVRFHDISAGHRDSCHEITDADAKQLLAQLKAQIDLPSTLATLGRLMTNNSVNNDDYDTVNDLVEAGIDTAIQVIKSEETRIAYHCNEALLTVFANGHILKAHPDLKQILMQICDGEPQTLELELTATEMAHTIDCKQQLLAELFAIGALSDVNDYADDMD